MDNGRSLERRPIRAGGERNDVRHSGSAISGGVADSGEARFGVVTRRAACCGVAFSLLAGAGVIPTRDKLTDDEKIELLRGLSAEYAKAKTYFPRSRKALAFDVDGTGAQKK